MDSHAVAKRLQSELMALMAANEPGASAFPDGDSLFSWIGTIVGPSGTVYESLSYKLSLKFPQGLRLFYDRFAMRCHCHKLVNRLVSTLGPNARP